MRKKKPISLTSRIFMHGVLLQNPVLVQVIGLCPAVAAAADLYVSALLSALVTGLLIVSECVASLLLKRIPRRIRVAVYFIIGLLVCAETAFFLEQNAPELREQAGVYLPLMAASSLVALRCEKIAVKQKLRVSFLDALANGLGASLVLLVSGFLRGLLGSGTVGDLVVFRNPPLRGLAMPFGGFLMLGFMAAFLKWFISVSLRQNVQMAFGIRRQKRKSAPVVQVQTAVPQPQPPADEADAAEETPETNDEPLPQDEPEPAPQPELPPRQTLPEDTAQSAAEAFYEQEADDDPQQELPDDLFAALDFSVQAELDAILADLGDPDDAADEGGAQYDA
ncbi:MAG: hypothetical protein IJT44_02900 [Clostridia bacterium]|nr:hypothetical protein [Clostridia bacterium]